MLNFYVNQHPIKILPAKLSHPPKTFKIRKTIIIEITEATNTVPAVFKLKAIDSSAMSFLSQKFNSLPEVHTCQKCYQESCEFHCNSSSECLWLL